MDTMVRPLKLKYHNMKRLHFLENQKLKGYFSRETIMCTMWNSLVKIYFDGKNQLYSVYNYCNILSNKNIRITWILKKLKKAC